MSHKVAKAARRAIRALGHKPREVELVPRKPIALFDLMGVPRGTFLGQRSLKPTCGRAVYRATKQGRYAAQSQNDSRERLAA